MVLHPETDSDSPIGSDWESGRDMPYNHDIALVDQGGTRPTF